SVGASLAKHPLGFVQQAEWSPSWQQRFLDAMQGVQTSANAVTNAYDRFAAEAGLPTCALTRRGRGAVGILARILPGAFGRDWCFTLRDDAQTMGERLKHAGSLVRRHRELSGQLSADWSPADVAAC